MEILVKLEKDFTQAFKEKNELATLTLRQLKSSLNNASIAKNRKELTEDEVVKVFRSEIKKRKDAIVLFRQGGRDDLAKKDQEEIAIISKYLPPEIDPEQIKQKISEAIKKTSASGLSDMGKVIGMVIKELGSAADASVISQLAKEALSQNKPE